MTEAGGSVPGAGKGGFHKGGNREIELLRADRTIRSSRSKRAREKKKRRRRGCPKNRARAE